MVKKKEKSKPEKQLISGKKGLFKAFFSTNAQWREGFK